MKTVKKHTPKIICVLMAACLVTVIAVQRLSPMVVQAAVFDESKAMRFSEYAADNTIEDCTLFIGTYLIHSQALTDELYELATTSAEDSNQMSVYYKSELSGGDWYDITEATGLAQIDGRSVRTEETELADLWVTHVVGSDGILKEVVSGTTVNAFDIPNPYDLYNLPELEPLRIQFDNTLSADSEGVDRYYYEHLRDFFELDLKNDTTDECDRQLEQMQPVYEELSGGDQQDLAEIVSSLIDKINSRRRAEIFYRLSQADDCELNKLQEIFSGSEYDEDEYDDEQFVENSSLMDALGTSIENCQSSYTEHSGNQLSRGETVLKNSEYEKSINVIDGSADGWSDAMETDLKQLQHIYHIEDDVIADASAELELLDNELIPDTESKYEENLKEGAGEAYRAAVANNMSQAAKDLALEERRIELEAIYSELQYVLDAKAKRMPVEDAMDALFEEIDKLDDMSASVAADDFEELALASIDSAKAQMLDVALTTANGSGTYNSEMQQLEDSKADLIEQQQQALDDNDLRGAKRLDAQVALVDQQIAEKGAELNDILNSSASSAADKARATVQSGSNTLQKNISNIKNKALEAIAGGSESDSGTLDNMVDALAALGAENALNEVKDSLEKSGSAGTSDVSDTLAAVDAAIEESKESPLHDAANAGAGDGAGDEGAGAGSGAGAGGADDEAALNAQLEAVFGDSVDNLSQQDQAAATAALDQLGKDGNTAAALLAQEYLEQFVANGSPYVYRKLANHSGEYIPLQVIAKAEGYRYIYENSSDEITLTKQGKLYKFVLYGTQVTLADKKTKTLTARVEKQDVPYIAEADAITYFSCEAEYLQNSDYAVCMTKKMKKKMEEYLAAVQEGVQ